MMMCWTRRSSTGKASPIVDLLVPSRWSMKAYLRTSTTKVAQLRQSLKAYLRTMTVVTLASRLADVSARLLELF